MAIYEYRCAACGSDFELKRSMSEAVSEAVCPSCGATAKKLPSIFASKDGYTLRVPSKEAFRGSPEPSENP